MRTSEAEPPSQLRGEPLSQLERLRDLYLMGDLTKAQYVMRRQAIEEEPQRFGPPTDLAIDRARALREDFAPFGSSRPSRPSYASCSCRCSSRCRPRKGASSPCS